MRGQSSDRPLAECLAGVFSRRLVGNNSTEQHLDATIAPQREQEARVTGRMFGIVISDGCLTIISGSAIHDSRLTLQRQLIERPVKIDFAEKRVADRSAVPFGQVRSDQIEAEPKWIFKDVDQH